MPRLVASVALVVSLCALGGAAAPGDRIVGVNVVLRTAVTDQALRGLANFGFVRDVIPQINAVTMQAAESRIPAIAALPFVAAAGPDQPREAIPVKATAAAADFSEGLSTWNLDAVNVTDPGAGRTVSQDGSGVYVAVLDSGLLKTWRTYFPEERIAIDRGRSFGGGGGEVGWVSEQPNKWELDQNSHGTHVTSTILGYSLNGTAINGVAPKATVVPVKVLNQNGRGWSSVIARGIVYAADLKATLEAPVIISMSLGGGRLDAVEKAAVDYAIARGVPVVAAAGNEGEAGMTYPGAYAPVISVAASGWAGEWSGPGNWWYASNVADPVDPTQFYITDFSGRAKTGQDLDVAAPGSWVVGPYQTNGQISYYFLGGTSMATPHVSGIVALMLQANAAVPVSGLEALLEGAAIPLAPGSLTVDGVVYTWGADATGHGLITADAALEAATTAVAATGGSARRRK
jgi:subtilisin family serine protease